MGRSYIRLITLMYRLPPIKPVSMEGGAAYTYTQRKIIPRLTGLKLKDLYL